MILILEDDSNLNSVLKVYFSMCFDSEVKMISSSQEALEFLKTEPKLSLVLLDYYLDEGPSTELATRVLALKSKPKLIIMSAMTEPYKVLKNVRRDGFIQKPFCLDQVTKRLGRVVKSKRKNLLSESTG